MKRIPIESVHENGAIYYVGREYTTEKDILTAKEILENAGFVPTESFILINAESGHRFENYEDQVHVKSGDEFIALPRLFAYYVNFEEYRVETAHLTVQKILEESGMLPVGDFVLVRESDGLEYPNYEEQVEIHTGEKFSAHKREITFFVNENDYRTQEKKLTVREIFELAGITTVEEYELVRVEGDYHFHDYDAEVSIHDKEVFLTIPRHHHETTFFVNHITCTTSMHKLSVKTILEDAGYKPVESYDLIRVSDNHKFETYDELVPIHDGESFTALYKGPTPVSWR